MRAMIRPRVFGEQYVWPQAPLFHRAGFEVLDQHIGMGDQLAHQGLTFGHAQIGAETERLLRAITSHCTACPRLGPNRAWDHRLRAVRP
jgi:hypothetical protein